MANPFLVLGGIAISVATAAFGILQVPGWVKSAQDASAKNDISQVTIAQAASLSATGKVKTSVAGFEADPIVGVKVSTDSNNTVRLFTGPLAGVAEKSYIVVVASKSGTIFARQDGGTIKTLTALPAEGTAFTTVQTTVTSAPAA